MFETEWDPATRQRLARRRFAALAADLPGLPAAFPTQESFARASIQQVLEGHPAASRFVECATLASCVFLNRGSRFEVHQLPDEAQMAPVFGICVADADGDGNEDVFIAQNFFPTRPEVSRHDGGVGVWLLGDGKGAFRSLAPAESGVHVPGEARGAAVADFNRDGRVDLAVAQNGGPTRLFVNLRARPGFRVRLQGPSGNPSGAGAVLQFVTQGRSGPVREIHAGSGYWSQDSAVVVMHSPVVPDQVRIRWPGGGMQVVPLPSQAREIVVPYRPDGSATPRS